jgi:hypothetical protein
MKDFTTFKFIFSICSSPFSVCFSYFVPTLATYRQLTSLIENVNLYVAVFTCAIPRIFTTFH